ncbi:hypothetical protein ACJMK2_038755, partial [Sinanodonta woodiana]
PRIYTWAIFWLLIRWTLAYQAYQDSIPNGKKVPNPCRANQFWNGVGHQSPLGGGVNNAFGKDFLAAGKVWTVALCQKDSDGDGKTNGAELGDSACVWTVGAAPAMTTGITHPGVCEPIGSAICAGKNKWVECGVRTKLNCTVFYEPETTNLAVRLPETDVPAKESSYVCMKYELPQNGVYHMVAVEPIIGTQNVVNQMFLYGCSDMQNANIVVNNPYVCPLTPAVQCTELLAMWTVGAPGRCFPALAGFKIGTSGYRYVTLQVHWSNPELVTTLKDNSGMRLYYTPVLRQHDAGVLVTGQRDLQIPPGELDFNVVGSCTSACSTEILTGSIWLTSSTIRMHRIGIYQQVAHNRNGSLLRYLNGEAFSYINYTSRVYPQPIEMKPGDELKTSCFYRSDKRHKTTQYAEGTYHELCENHLIYYPKSNVRSLSCLQWGTLSSCELKQDIVRNCPYKTFFKANAAADILQTVDLIKQNCAADGTCRKECKGAVRTARTHPCLQGDIGRKIRKDSLKLTDSKEKYRAMLFYAELNSCSTPLVK